MLGERVAIQGELGSFSHEATLQAAAHLGFEPKIVPCTRSAEVFRQLASGEVDAAVIPIENSLAGSVLEHYDLLRAHPVHIVHERLLRIRHNLIAAPGAVLTELIEVYSHSIALEQCRRFLAEHPALRPTSFYDTAGSVAHVLTPALSGRAGAIASREAAQVHGGAVLVEGIEDTQQNYTRFFLLRRGGATLTAAQAPSKISLCFAVQNRAGSLVEALEVFAGRKLNLTRLESRPVLGEPWRYIFYTDFEIGSELASAQAALEALRNHCSMLKVLGCYPAAEQPGVPG